MNDKTKGILAIIGAISVFLLLWPLIKSIIYIVIVLLVLLFIYYTFFYKKDNSNNYHERHDTRKPNDAIDVEFKSKKKDD